MIDCLRNWGQSSRFSMQGGADYGLCRAGFRYGLRNDNLGGTN